MKSPMLTIQMLAEKLTPMERFEALKQWTGDSAEDGGGGGHWLGIAALLAGVVLLFGFIFVASVLTSPRKKRVLRDPRRLFKQAVQQMGLEAPARQMLARLAADSHAENPVVLMVSPRVFDAAAEQWLSHASPAEMERQRSALAGLRRRVFADPVWADAYLPASRGLDVEIGDGVVASVDRAAATEDVSVDQHVE